MTLKTGTHLGPYEILGPLGAGGMGEVYEALDARLERKVAVKVLPDRVAGDPVAMARFEREAKAVAALSHPNILAIFDFGRAGDAAYAVTELLEGETLRARLEAGPIPPRKAVAMARQVASGIGAAHEKGIIHRDLKPENLFVVMDGAVKILDFGLAVQGPPAAGDAAGTQTPTREQITTPGSVVGTTSYMSPEQVRGQTVDHRSDIFSLGSVLYEMLAGARAFHAETAAETMTAVLREDPAELPPERTIPTALERIVRRCLEKRPEERFHSAHDLAFALGNVWGASSSREQAAVTAAEAPSTRPARIGRRLVAAASMLLLGALGGAFVMQRLDRPVVTEPVRTRQLTFSGRDGQPDVSPDGRLIVFSSSRGGQSRIWVKQYPGGGETALTDGPDHAPRFSPDQTSLLFVRGAPGGSALFRVPLVGGTPRKLLDDVAEADWSPDGQRIVVLHRPVITSDGITQQVGVVGADGTGERELMTTTNRALTGVRWSPDGSRIAVTSLLAVNNSQAFILLVDVETGETTTIQPLDFNATGVAWSGRGEAIVYGSNQDLTAGVSGSAARIARQDLRSGETRTLMWAQSLFAGSGYGSSTLDVGAPGTLVYGALALKQNLSARAIDGAGGVASTLLTRGASRDRQPVYTPDGESVIFSSNRSGNLDLWSMSLKTGSITRLTEDTADDWDPAVTPDGSSLLWSSSRSGSLEIWTANRDGTGARQVSHDGVDAENPTCTPDGRWIVYSSGNPDRLGIWKIHPDGSGAALLVPGSHFLPEVSPDGRYASFVSNAPSETANLIRVVELETGEIVPFEILVPRSAPGRVEGPGSGDLGRSRWRSDGQALLFLGVDAEDRRGVYEQVFAIGRDTAGTRRPVAGFSPETMTESFAVSPDGRRIVLSQIEQAYSLVLAENLPGVEPPSRP